MRLGSRRLLTVLLLFFGFNPNLHAAKIVQITDLHISHHLDDKNVKRLDLCLNYIVQKVKPDVVLVTGDLVYNPLHDHQNFKLLAYYSLKKKLDALKIPYFVIPGNHDDSFVVARVFGKSDCCRHLPFMGHLIDLQGLILIGVDSFNPKTTQGKGIIADKELEWLKAVFHKYKNHDKIIFVHQPLITKDIFPLQKLDNVLLRTFIEKIYNYCFEEKSALAFYNLFKNDKNIKAILSGHLHLAAHLDLPSGHPLYISPSIAPTKKQFLENREVLNLLGVTISRKPGFTVYNYNALQKKLLTEFYFMDSKNPHKAIIQKDTLVNSHETQKINDKGSVPLNKVK
jgi:DNA repair exonuclease SbcCD nuclease subunit